MSRVRVYPVREMMIGLRERFRYGECPSCGCLQLLDPPADLSRYYQDGYYSFERDPEALHRGLRRWYRAFRDGYAFTGRGAIGRAIAKLFPYRYGNVAEWLAITGTTAESPILDVGCGSGELVYDLAARGFCNVQGIDPFLSRERTFDLGVRISKRGIDEVDGRFHLIMFHHSLEHIPDQHQALKAAADLLEPGGYCLVRIPTVSSWAWEAYREDWVQIDAPRHFVLHSRQSLRELGQQVGLTLEEVRYDSTELQFVGSELYRRDVPLRERAGKFSRREIRAFRRHAAALNQAGSGDQAAFYLRKA
jgi:SAM-dependent methyltransferase